MKFNISYQRAVAGNDIEVQIEAEGEEVIVSVDYNLDGFDLDRDDLSDAPVVFFHRTLSQVGDASPGKRHKLTVGVHGKAGEPTKNGSRVWTDLI
jgi:hypothetical protein